MNLQAAKKLLTPVRIVLGVIFLILGILGLFLPVLQGLLFLTIAAALLGKDTPPGRWLYQQVQRLRNRTFRRREK
ncbi:MAG TPA: hypothetical protein ENJ23_01640 [Bacteroidetes bacterium]|nr:hypothetical protein [Bacteroidota bacterium]